MGLASEPNSEATLLLPTTTSTAAAKKIPNDPFHLTYVNYFTLGLGYLLPLNAFITAVDYFTYFYPDVSVDRVFSVAYILVGLASLLLIVFSSAATSTSLRINLGLALFVVSLLIVPIMGLVYVKGQVGFYVTVTVAAIPLVQGSLIGAAGDIPERYMHAVVAGTAGSGVLVSVLRIVTKAVYQQTGEGLRASANLYFAVGIAVMAVCVVLYIVAPRIR